MTLARDENALSSGTNRHFAMGSFDGRQGGDPIIIIRGIADPQTAVADVHDYRPVRSGEHLSGERWFRHTTSTRLPE